VLDKTTKFDGTPQTLKSLWRTVEIVKQTDKVCEEFRGSLREMKYVSVTKLSCLGQS